MSARRNYSGLLLPLLLSVFLLTAHAGEEDGKGGKDNLHSRVETITVNIQGSAKQYVQVELMLALAKPDADDKIKKYMPVIRHKLILLLTSKDIDQLGSSEGKLKLAQEAKNAINKALELTDKEGVTEVLFDSFIIQ